MNCTPQKCLSAAPENLNKGVKARRAGCIFVITVTGAGVVTGAGIAVLSVVTATGIV